MMSNLQKDFYTDDLLRTGHFRPAKFPRQLNSVSMTVVSTIGNW